MQATSKHAFLPKINKIGTRLLNQTLKTARIWVQETKKKTPQLTTRTCRETKFEF
jgi:hypothetical protein